MGIIGILFVLIVVGVLLYLLNNVVPLDPKIRMIINVVVVLLVLVWLAQAFGLFDVGPHAARIRTP